MYFIISLMLSSLPFVSLNVKNPESYEFRVLYCIFKTALLTAIFLYHSIETSLFNVNFPYINDVQSHILTRVVELNSEHFVHLLNENE